MEKASKKNLLSNIKGVMSIGWQTDKKFFISLILLTLVAAVFPIILSYFYKLILDEVIKAQTTIGTVTVALISLFSLRYILEVIATFRNIFHYEYVERIYRYKLENYLTFNFVKKISELDLGYFENSDTQNIIQKTRRGYTYRIPNFIMNLFYVSSSMGSFIGSAVVLTSFGYWIPIAMAAATIPRFVLRNKISEIEWSIYGQNTPQSKELTYISDILDDPTSVKEVRVLQAGPMLLKRMLKLQDIIFQGIKKPLRKYLNTIYFPLLIETAVLFWLGYIKLGPTVSGLITLGSFTFYFQMLDRIHQSSQEVGDMFGRLYENNLYVGYYFQVMKLEKLVKEPAPGYEFEEIKPPKIQFNSVGFGYEDGPPVPKNISFSLDPGEHLAIVGPNGAGKSTLVKLLLRFYDPTKGEILINDVNLKEIRSEHWYKFVSTLFQDFVKFLLTIKDNIILGNLGTNDDKKAEEAAKKSGAHEFIEKLPKKYNQRLGKRFEDSTELSQGQWQKLALSRVFYEEAPVLILDEPTSSIDAEAEAKIFDNLYKLYQNKTLILISHRFSTVRNADKIIVLKEGRIVEEGNHESLMKKDGIYATMFNKQAKGYLE